jgi:NADH-quinone oxidoreductase subunit K
MANIPVEQALLLAGLLFILGMIGVIIRRNFFFILLSIEIMFNAAGLVFVIASSYLRQVDGQIMFLFILTVAAAEVSIGLALVIRLYNHYRTLDVDKISQMRG